MPRPRYRILAAAWAQWEQTADVPHLLTDVVDAMDALPRGDLEVVIRSSRGDRVHEVLGRVYGRRFGIRGTRDARGRWLEVRMVRVLPEG